MLVIYGLKWALASASSYHGHFDFPGMVYFFCLFIMAEMMLRFYNTPLPWVGSSFSQLLPDTAMQFARAVSLGQLNTLVGHFDVINKALETQPLSITNISGVPAYLMVFLTMLIIQGVLFCCHDNRHCCGWYRYSTWSNLHSLAGHPEDVLAVLELA